MQVRVSNVSKLALKEMLRTLFAKLGTLVYFAHYPNVARHDGSYEVLLVYGNVSEARRALALDGAELGDRRFEVRLEGERARFAHGDSRCKYDRTLRDEGGTRQPLRTALVWGLTGREGVGEVEALCGGPSMVSTVLPLVAQGGAQDGTQDGAQEGAQEGREGKEEAFTSALVEFKSKTDMHLAFERLNVAKLSDGSYAKIDEAWMRVDPLGAPNPLPAEARHDERHDERHGERHGERHAERYGERDGDRYGDRYGEWHSERHDERYEGRHGQRAVQDSRPTQVRRFRSPSPPRRHKRSRRRR